jgi:putative transposase
MALGQRHSAAVIHHSDQGPIYSLAFGKRCDKAGVRPSMGSVGDCLDNAMCESFFATSNVNCSTVFEFIEGWYNPHRRHSAIAIARPLTTSTPLVTTLGTAALHRPPNRGNSNAHRMIIG